MSEQIGWVWEESTQRYRDLATGRFVSRDQVVELVNEVVDRTTDGPVSVLNTMLADGRISVADWEVAFARQIKNAYIHQAELAAGGRQMMTPQLWGSLGTPLRQQYGYLADFARQIAEEQLTIGQIEMRTRMYVNSSRSAFWSVKNLKARATGFTSERWVAIGDANTCVSCFEADAMGWMPLGTFGTPGSGSVIRGQTQCSGLTSCRCIKEYAR